MATKGNARNRLMQRFARRGLRRANVARKNYKRNDPAFLNRSATGRRAIDMHAGQLGAAEVQRHLDKYNRLANGDTEAKRRKQTADGAARVVQNALSPTTKKRKGKLSKKHRDAISKGMKKSSKVKVAAKKRTKRGKGKTTAKAKSARAIKRTRKPASRKRSKR